jgi:hypothetical protein
MVNGCVKVNVNVTGDLLAGKHVSVYNYITTLFLKRLTRACLSPKRVEKEGLRTHLCQKLGYLLPAMILTGFLLNPIKVSTFYSQTMDHA